MLFFYCRGTTFLYCVVLYKIYIIGIFWCWEIVLYACTVTQNCKLCIQSKKNMTRPIFTKRPWILNKDFFLTCLQTKPYQHFKWCFFFFKLLNLLNYGSWGIDLNLLWYCFYFLKSTSKTSFLGNMSAVLVQDEIRNYS